MKWIVMLLGGYTLYYLVLIVFDALKNSAPMADDEDTQIIGQRKWSCLPMYARST